jgi:hypothetical protein
MSGHDHAGHSYGSRYRGQPRRDLATLESEPGVDERRGQLQAHPHRPDRLHRDRDRRSGDHRHRLIEWICDFQPDPQLRAHVLGTLRAEAQNNGGDNAERRRELHGQLDRLRDLYVLGDLTKNQYVLKRQALQEELERTSPPLDPRLDQAEALLSDFARFWQTEPSSAERRKLLASLFDRIWQDSGVIVAVKSRPPFVRYFKTAERLNRRRTNRRGDKGGSDGG